MSESSENSSTTGAGRKEYDCAECGLCCIDIGGPLYVYPADRDRWQDAGVTGLTGKFATTDADHPCPFLTSAKPFRCTIYPLRPHVCTVFANGEGACRDLRRKHGLPV
jgi:Fe-S-cluster containining protein